MMENKSDMGMGGIEHAEMLLKQLLHLKRYETPDDSRMTRNKQNIMRHVRKASRSRRKSLGDQMEINFPWFFAEPKYGVALLFVAFAGLNYLGTNARNAAQSRTGIYTTTDRFASYEQPANTSTNPVVYSEVSPNLRLFPEPRGNENILEAGVEQRVGPWVR